MIEGLRDTGYDFNTAVADIIDNSIAAQASVIKVQIEMDYRGNVTLAIADNGTGMNYDELLNAMKYGSPHRPDRRSLGKFGLGLKTASTAFCRHLSVISRRTAKGDVVKATWDLDHVATSGKWELLIPRPEQEEIQLLEKVAQNHSGTVVKWEKIDRLLKDYDKPNGRPAQNALSKKREELIEHVAMVYQRFLDKSDGRESQKIKIYINEKLIEPWDPFCIDESELVAAEKVPIETEDSKKELGKFVARAFVLPRREEFSSPEAEQRAQISNENQGIYIYRENRLIHSADWLGAFSKEPHGSLLRVEFSFGADLDEALQVDIKKSKITLNESLFEWLRDEFLPAPRRAANERYRLGVRKATAKAAKDAHDSSNKSIGKKEAQIDQAKVDIINLTKGEVEVENEYGKTRLRIKISSPAKPGEVFVQPAESIADGLLWEPALIEKHQAVRINSNHDFYRKVYLPNIVSNDSSTSTIQGLDSLLWALAVAELRAVTDTTKEHFFEMRFEISKILRKLVEHLPETQDPNGNDNGK
jgi:hypothetical protein